tara:strand:- start:2998 stop:3330 length:333 start_codon:yes stop_codon:yes gene_type:complete
MSTLENIIIHFNKIVGNNFHFSNLKKIYISFALIFTNSCSAEYENAKNYSSLVKLEGFEEKNIFLIKDTVYVASCDVSGNKLLIKFTNKGKAWKRSKYISKGCTKNLEKK